MLKHLYSRFLKASPGWQHYACHSHHFWPDVTREAMLEYWDDSAHYVDEKWQYIFSEKAPKLQQYIADILGTSQPEQIVFAPNTHELLFRLISCFDLSKPLTILTTDSEFHSFSRQSFRLEEMSNIKVVRIASQPFEDFSERFKQAVAEVNPDILFFSQVFFNSGVAVSDIEGIVDSVENPETMVVIDGYHAYTAIPVDISKIKHRIFYLAGGYKYAQGGEGICFMHCPQGVLLRPMYTGWYAEFGELQKFKTRKVDYSTNGFHYAGSTMDYSGVYRQLAVFDMWEREKVTVEQVHSHVQELQRTFLDHLASLEQEALSRDLLQVNDINHHGHFLTFKLHSAQRAGAIYNHLKSNKILTDYRGDRLRFGFAPYHLANEIDLSCLEQFND